MRSLLLAIVLVGCTKENPDFCPNHPDDPRCGGDMGSDGGVDGDAEGIDAPPDAPACVGAAPFEICAMPPPSNDITLSGSLDTDGTMCSTTQLWSSSGQTPSCFVAAGNITVSNLTVTGSRPLVLVASNEMTVTGLLDAASHVSPVSVGPGVPAIPCGTFTATPVNATGAGGGAGASLAPDGGPGEDGGDGDNGNADGGGRYTAFLNVPPGLLRGGCNGQTGGMGQGNGGVGGSGGGALYLVAGVRITMGAAAIINASGAGGSAPGKTAGGGGGGSGGMVLLHAPSFVIASGAIVVANGGSGSTGGESTMSGAGVRGNDPDPTNPTVAAPGGTGASGPGGNGFALGHLATAGGTGPIDNGGGGGGGGGGYIQSNMALTNATVSPAANVVP